MMLNKRFEEITLNDIQRLIANKTNEDTYLEYKMKLSFDASGKIHDATKTEFVKDISAFANAEGGLIIFGIEEKEHLPVEIKGVNIEDEDALRRRIMETVSAHTDPSFTGIRMRSIPSMFDQAVFLIRVEKNTLALPLRNKLDNRFWLRTDNKVSSMATAAIVGYANTRHQKEDVSQKIIGYKADKLNEILANANDRIIAEHSYVIMQLVPEDFDSFYCDIKTIRENVFEKRGSEIMPERGGNTAIESDGFLTFHSLELVKPKSVFDPIHPVRCTEYFKFYKNGAVEWASDWLICKPYIDWPKMAAYIFALTKKILVYYTAIAQNSPLRIGITLTNVQGCCVSLGYNNQTSRGIEANMFQSEEISLKEHNDYSPFLYKRFLDDLFNVLGLSGCPIYIDEKTLNKEAIETWRIEI